MAASNQFKFLCSAPGMVFVGVILLLISIILGRLFGASYFAMATLTLCFLITLIIYLVLQLFEEKLLKRFRKFMTENDN